MMEKNNNTANVLHVFETVTERSISLTVAREKERKKKIVFQKHFTANSLLPSMQCSSGINTAINTVQTF